MNTEFATEFDAKFGDEFDAEFGAELGAEFGAKCRNLAVLFKLVLHVWVTRPKIQKPCKNVEKLRENVEKLREHVGVGGMAEPLKFCLKQDGEQLPF